jgi:hypothetical protein
MHTAASAGPGAGAPAAMGTGHAQTGKIEMSDVRGLLYAAQMENPISMMPVACPPHHARRCRSATTEGPRAPAEPTRKMMLNQYTADRHFSKSARRAAAVDATDAGMPAQAPPAAWFHDRPVLCCACVTSFAATLTLAQIVGQRRFCFLAVVRVDRADHRDHACPAVGRHPDAHGRGARGDGDDRQGPQAYVAADRRCAVWDRPPSAHHGCTTQRRRLA